MRQATIRALEIRDEADIVRGLSCGDLEARILDADRAQASELKPKSQASVSADPDPGGQAARLDKLLSRAGGAAERLAADNAEREARAQYAARTEREAQAEPEPTRQAHDQAEAEP